MPKPTEHKTVQARLLAYAQEIGWRYVPRAEAEARRGRAQGTGLSCPGEETGWETRSPLSLFFGDLVHARVCAFNPQYREAEGALVGEFQRLHSDITGNRDFLEALRNRRTFFCEEERRELDLTVIDYGDLDRPPEARRNVYEVTEEFVVSNGRFTTREDVVFLINGIPVLFVECKNATKDEAVALGVDQIRRYHAETPESMVPQMLFTATEAIGFAYGVTWNTVRRNIFAWKAIPQENGFSNPLQRGQECQRPCGEKPCGLEPPRPFSEDEPFFDKHADIDAHRRNLPHWQQGHVWCFVTWRLGDSLPKAKLDQWATERSYWLKQHPKPWDEATESDYHELFSHRMDEWLDQGNGSCLLRDPANAKIVAEALRHFNGDRYMIASFVVMPNHVHVLFRPLGGHTLAEILKSWKGFTACEINRRTGAKGALWQDEYWDRLVRNQQHFAKSEEYIRDNPVKAGLKTGEFIWGNGKVPENGFSNPLNRGQECPHPCRETPRGLENPRPCDSFEAKVKAFCAVPHVLRLLRDFIVFAEKDEELQKIILRQHQAAAVDRTVARCLDPVRTRGLVWHTQGSGKTHTLMKSAELLFRAPEAEKPTVLLLIDRNELEDQMLKNLASVGLGNVAHADSMAALVRLLRSDYRGIIVTMIHKFRDMPAAVTTRRNVYVLIDEAHRTTGGDLGTFLMAGLPHATFVGFTGTPVDKTAYGRGTFKVFGCEDDQGYLHKYSIAESIADGTTLPLYYGMAPNEMLVPHEVMEKEFLALAEPEGVSDIEELNKILDRAVNLKNFLKGKERVAQVAAYVAEHYRTNVEPMGYKAFLVAVDREACVFYKEALDALLPPEYSEIVFTGSNNDQPHLKRWHLDPKREKQLRNDFKKQGLTPKILIVTEKLLTGFDAPILYAMYLDKPMRDHTLLQAIARVNRPYENEAEEQVKPHGFVLDFVGIFDKLSQALAFDSQEISAIVKDIRLLKQLFKAKMESVAPAYLALIGRGFDDKDVDNLIEHFRDKERRKAFFREYKEIEMLYEIVSPDAFLRPFMDDYATLSNIYEVVRNAYARRVYVDRGFLRKTNELVQQHIGAAMEAGDEPVKVGLEMLEAIRRKNAGQATKVINLIKAIEKRAEEESDDPFLIALGVRAQAVLEKFEDRQMTTGEALDEILREIENEERRKREQAAKGLDSLTYFVLCKLVEEGIPNAEAVSRRVSAAFSRYTNWKNSEAELRELRKQVTFALVTEEDDMAKVATTVDALFTLLRKSAGQ